ncbi:MAG: type II secretion system GspH family protein [Candidatus Gastranaerophilales bacterium]|nr:type II secretion system GspH family protein [Candidatus Gastranaerophilales bacterium]
MKKLGFTLAEVLITLVIIGVIAAMTVPSLMNNTNAQEFRSAFKKAISGANQALTLHYALEGLAASDYTDATDLVDEVFKTRMSIMDGNDQYVVEVGGADSSNCWTTADGITFCINNWENDDSEGQGGRCDSYNQNSCSASNDSPNLYIDVNGAKNPNKLTESSDRPRDIYTAAIYSQKVIPVGDAAQQVMYDKQVSSTQEGEGE